MDQPQVLIVSSEAGKAVEIAKDLGSKFLATKDNIQYFSWDIDNKYYTAPVLLCVSERLTLDIPVDDIEAVVLYHEPKAGDTKNLDNYVPLIQSLTEADVHLLACGAFPSENKRDEVLEWCHIHKFELVDMVAPDSFDAIDDDMEAGKLGIERIIEALHTHSWPNRTLKGIPNGRISTSNEPDVSQVEDQLENIRLNAPREAADYMLMNSVLDGIMGGENADFGELFGQLMAMKQHASTLSSTHRRAAAEQLVTAFWRAMGGDPSEVDSIDGITE